MHEIARTYIAFGSERFYTKLKEILERNSTWVCHIAWAAIYIWGRDYQLVDHTFGNQIPLRSLGQFEELYRGYELSNTQVPS